MRFQLLALIFVTSTLLHLGEAATLRTRPGTRDGTEPVRRHLQSGKGSVTSGKGGTETRHSSDDKSGAVISRSTGSGGKGKGWMSDMGDITIVAANADVSTTRPRSATGGKGASSLGKGGTPSSGKGTSLGGKGSTSSRPDDLFLEDSKEKNSSDDQEDGNSTDNVRTSGNVPSQSGDENTFDLGVIEPEPDNLTPNEISNVVDNRNFGSLSNDDP